MEELPKIVTDDYTKKFIEMHDIDDLNVKIGIAPVDLIYDKITKKQYSVMASTYKFNDFNELINFFEPNMYIYQIIESRRSLLKFEDIEKHNAFDIDFNKTITEGPTDICWVVRHYKYDNGVRVILSKNLISCHLNNAEWNEIVKDDEENEVLDNKIKENNTWWNKEKTVNHVCSIPVK